jgi:hypothetical protein
MIKLLVLSSLSAAGQPQEGVPCLAADVRPPIAKRAVFADLWRSPRPRGAVSVTKQKKCEAPARRRTERSGAGAAHRSGCSRSARSPGGAKWRNRGDGAEPPYAKRCALRRCVAQCAFERSGFLATLSRAKRSTMTAAGQPQEGAPLPCCGCSATSCEALRSSPTFGEVRVYAELVLSLINNARRRHDGARNGVERAERHGAGLAECAESSGAKWRRRGDGAEPPYAKRCALRRSLAQCAFERSRVLTARKQSEAERYDRVR